MDNNLTLLYVADNPELLKNVTYLFETYISNILTAQNSSEALEKYIKYKPDIVISEISMPKYNSLELVKRIRREDKYVPIVIISTFYGLEQLSTAIDINVSSYIKKPFTLDTLQRCITKAIEESQVFADREALQEKFTLINHDVIMLTTDKNFIITEVTDALVTLTGYSREEFIGSKPSIVSSGDTPSIVYKNLYATITLGYIWHGEIKSKTKNGEYYWVALSITPLFDKQSNIKGYTAIQTNITNTKLAEEKANIDPLTLLYNRTTFDKVLHHSINTAKRHTMHFTYMMIDIDYFKRYNDEYGHQNGDTALQGVASVLQKHTKREHDYAFRIGGEEFVLILLGLDEIKSLEFANKIREDVLTLEIEHKHNCAHKFLSVSLGVYIANGNEILNKDDIYLRADKALYTSKNTGRNKVTLTH